MTMFFRTCTKANDTGFVAACAVARVDTDASVCETKASLAAVQFVPQDIQPLPKWRNWQTRMVQVHVPARVWGFESLLRHHLSSRNIRYATAGICVGM